MPDTLTRPQVAAALGLTVAQVRHAEQSALSKLRAALESRGFGPADVEIIGALLAGQADRAEGIAPESVLATQGKAAVWVEFKR